MSVTFKHCDLFVTTWKFIVPFNTLFHASHSMHAQVTALKKS